MMRTTKVCITLRLINDNTDIPFQLEGSFVNGMEVANAKTGPSGEKENRSNSTSEGVKELT